MSSSSAPAKEEALVIRSIRHGESSRIATLFGRARGKFAVIAKGARRSKTSAGVGNIEPGHRVEAIVYFKPSRSVQNLGQVTLIDAYPRVKEDLCLTSFAAVVLELLNRAFIDGESNPEAYDAATEALEALDLGPLHPRIVLWRFQLKVIKAVGFSLDPNPCPVCGREPAATGHRNLLLLEAGAICCQDCQPTEEPSLQLSGESVSLLRRIERNSDPGLGRLKPSRAASRELTYILERFLRYHNPALGQMPALEMLETLDNS